MNPRHLTGQWRLDRTLLDRDTGQRGCAHGTLRVTEALDWHEAGELTWSGRTTPFTRSLKIRWYDGEWWFHFADGRLFHPWRPGEEVTHPCGADVYTGRIEVYDDRVRMRWDVHGPDENQRYVTGLRRSPGC